MRIRFSVFLTLVFATPLLAIAGDIHPDDRALIEILVRAKAATNESALAKAAGTSARDTRIVGPDARWMRFARGGDEVTIWIDAIVHRSTVAAIRLRSLGGSDTWKQAAAKALGNMASVKKDGLDHRLEHTQPLDRYRKATHAMFKTPPATPWGGFTDDVRTLMDPLGDLDYGTSCYEAGEAPPGRPAADRLRLQGNWSAFAAILKGLNPEGRLYAAQALLLLAAEGVPVSKDARDAIDVVRRMKVQVSTCNGSLVQDRTPHEVMGEPGFLVERACTILEQVRVDGARVENRFIIVYWDGTYAVRHRLLTPMPPDSPRMLRGRLTRRVFDEMVAFLRTARTKLQFVVDADGTPLPAAIAAVAREVPRTR